MGVTVTGRDYANRYRPEIVDFLLGNTGDWQELTLVCRFAVEKEFTNGSPLNIRGNKMIISDGYNGTPSGFENFCEDDEGYTKWYVLHAEANAILKVAASTQSCKGATLYITMSPCKECSKLIHQAGVVKVVYNEAYKDDSGLKFLEKAGISLERIEDLKA